MKKTINVYTIVRINEFSKIARYNTNTQKSDVFLYSNDGHSEEEIKKAYLQ